MKIGDFLSSHSKAITRSCVTAGGVALYAATVNFYERRIDSIKQQIETQQQTIEMMRHTQFDAQFSQIDAEQKLAALRMKRVVSSIQVLGGDALDPEDVTHRYMCLRLNR
jgi:hypothetical protein